jgi:hypothetical protein
MAVPPVFVGAVKLIVAVVVPVEVAVPIVGESGAIISVAGNTTVMVPPLTAFEADVDPLTVK